MKSKFDLLGKVVVLTGGAGTLGSHFVECLASAGAHVVSADLKPGVEKVFAEGGSIYPMQMDITKKTSISKLVDDVNVKFGKIDVLVNNAYPRNKAYGQHFFDVTYENFSENVSLHLGGYFLCSQQFAAYFKEQGRGNIVNIASIYGVIAPDFDIYRGTSMTMPVEYAAIKSAVIHLTKYMAEFLGEFGVRVNSLSPGGIEDGQPAIFLEQYKARCARKGMLEPKDIEGALMFLVSDQSEFMTGQNLIVDDGFTT